MNRILKKALTFGFIALLLFTGCHKKGQQIAQKSESNAIELPFGLNDSIGSIQYEASVALKEFVEKESNSSLKITLYPSRTLFNSDLLQAAKMLKYGDMAMGGGITLPHTVSDIENIAITPYLFESKEQVNRLFSTELFTKTYIERMKEQGIFPLLNSYTAISSRHVLSKTPITSLADFSNRKFRVPNVDGFTNMVSLLGAKPFTIPFNDVFIGLKNGLIDTVENELQGIVNMKFYEVAKNLTLTSHMFALTLINFSDKIWQTLSPEQQKIILEGATLYHQKVTQLADEEREKQLQILKDNGVKIISIDTTPLKEAMKDYYTHLDQKLAEDGLGENLLEKTKELVSNQ